LWEELVVCRVIIMQATVLQVTHCREDLFNPLVSTHTESTVLALTDYGLASLQYVVLLHE